jgi:hypothetical protein
MSVAGSIVHSGGRVVTREKAMDERQGAAEKPVRGGSLGKGVVLAYLRTGAALAILRVSLLAWLEYRYPTHISETYYDLLSFLRPEILLAGYTRVGAIPFESVLLHFLFWASLLTLGSFIIATPILLVGWLRHRRR